ncbi:MAG: hypothetical protein IPP52_13355 [Ignavibacteria bacterium]|nr:hypothetical protein [Ignavibacteria bacterium]
MNKLIYIFLIIVTAQFVFSKPRNDNPNNAKNNSTIILDNNTPNSTSAFVKLQTRFDPNRVDTWFQNSGTFNQDIRTNNTPGFQWPTGSSRFAIFTSGLSIGCYYNGSIRQAAASYAGEYAPGYIDQNGVVKTDARFRIYKIKAGDNAATNPDYAAWGDMIPFGAPYVDMNNDGVYSPGVDIPGIKDAEQTLFLCMTDGFPERHAVGEGFGGGTAPINAEVHLTLWGYNTQGLEDLQFVNWVVINKSNTTWERTFFSVIVDPDLGDATDDYIGCDTSAISGNKDMAFCYNADNIDGSGSPPSYGQSPPASGMDFFQSPIIRTSNPNDSVSYYFPPGSSNKVTKQGKQLGLSSFVYFTNTGSGGVQCEQDPGTPLEAYRYQTGIKKDGTPWLYPGTLQPTKFCYPGDPERFTGWSERGTNGVSNLAVVKNCGGVVTGTPEVSPPGDRRFIFNSGDSLFNVAPGDTQIIVLGQFVAKGTSNLNSVTQLKRTDATAQSLYNSNFAVNAPPPSPEVSVSIGTQNAALGQANISFAWGDRSESYLVWDSLLQPRSDSSFLKFEGYEIYEIKRSAVNIPDFNDPASINNDVKLLQIYDKIDTVGIIIDTLPTGISVNGVPQYGNFPVVPYYTAPIPNGFPNTGIFRNYLVTQTAYPEENGGSTSLIYGNTYKFAIVAYAYRTNPKSKSDRKVVRSPFISAIKTIVPQSSVAGSEFIIKNGDTINTNRRDLGVMPIVKNQDQLKTALYKINFNAPDTSYNILRSENSGVSFDTLYKNNKYIKSSLGTTFPDDSSKIVDGVLIKVQKILNAGVIRDTYTPKDSTQAKLEGWEYEPATNVFLTGVDTLGGYATQRPYQNKSMSLSYPNANTFSGTGTTITPERLHKVVIEYSDTNNGQMAYRYVNNTIFPPADPSFAPYIISTGAAFRYQDMRKVPFKVYEVIDAGDSLATSVKRQVNCAFLENNDSLFATVNGVQTEVGRGKINGMWDPTTFRTGGLEILYIFASDYNSAPNTFYTTKNLRTNQSQFDITFVWNPKRINNSMDFKSGDKFTIYPYTVTRPVQITGVPLFYEFRTTAPVVGNSDLAKSQGDLDKIRAVPNPFYGFSDIQRNTSDRYITFRRLPKVCNIKIFTLSGDFIRKLDKNNDESTLTWDIKNLESVPIASGMYIALIEAPGIGEKIIKLAIFTSEERIGF